jgi:hypothetical protein
MVIPSIPWWLAFAIGLPIGIVGYLGQAYFVGRRSRRTAGAWGPARPGESAVVAAVTEPGTSATPVEADLDASLAVTPSRRRERRYGTAQSGNRTTDAPGAPARGSTEAPAPAAGEALHPVRPGAVAQRRSRNARLAQLRRRETYLEDALDVIVAFVDGEPSRARARTCARGLDKLLPKTRRSPELRALFQDLESGRAIADLQDDAEQVGVQLAIELKVVKTELVEQTT